jgi:hypothetical protein
MALVPAIVAMNEYELFASDGAVTLKMSRKI